MGLLDDIKARGLLAQCTDTAALEEAFGKEKLTFYVGFDPTADSMHIGHLMPIMLMHWLQEAGHRPIVVLGGGTALIGDPSGKDKTREMLSAEQIKANIEGMRAQFGRYLNLDDAIVIDNHEWLSAFGYIEFLRDVGKHFSVNRMLTAESMRLRLERNQGLSFIEFNYHLLQSYDFLELNRRYDCTLQCGGDDQWFNILGGVDLVRRVTGETVHALTVPLITTSTGKKMGKTERGSIWLDPERCPPYDFYQYWINVDDADVGRFLRVYTWLSLEAIAELESKEGAELRQAKQVLAFEATKLAHGADAAEDARFVSEVLFAKRQELSVTERERVVRVLRTSDGFPKAAVSLPAPLVDVLCSPDSGLCKSKGEARRLISQGGARIWGQQVRDVEAVLEQEAVVWAGKKRAALVVKP